VSVWSKCGGEAKVIACIEDQPVIDKIPSTRELILHENYRLVYEIVASTVWVLALVHTASKWLLVK
jgi:addiction module RelE/StbE family toxin